MTLTAEFKQSLLKARIITSKNRNCKQCCVDCPRITDSKSGNWYTRWHLHN